MLGVFNKYWQKNFNHVVDSILPINNLFYLAAEWTMSVWELTVLTADNFRIGIRQKYSTEIMVAWKTIYVKYIKIWNTWRLESKFRSN